MALALIFLGFMLVSTGLKGTQGDLGKLIVGDFTGAGNFWYFIVGVIFLGSIGYYSPMKSASRMLITLVIVVFLLSNQGLWVNLRQAVETSKPGASPAPTKAAVPVSVGAADPNTTVLAASVTGTTAATSQTGGSVSAGAGGVSISTPGLGGKLDASGLTIAGFGAGASIGANGVSVSIPDIAAQIGPVSITLPSFGDISLGDFAF